jgi:glycosyltransferase involved in cell wall biosynthesis
MPNRYEPAVVGLSGIGERVARRAVTLAAVRLPRLIERVVFGAAPGYPGAAIRRALCWALRAHATAVQADFDSAFYLQQMPTDQRRHRAARAPLLHYLTVGCAERRSPHPAFDAGFYRRRHPDLPLLADPLRHYVRQCRGADCARNEWEAAPGGRGHAAGRESVLVLHHARGGGSSEFLWRYEGALRAEGYNVVRLRAVGGSPNLAVIDGVPWAAAQPTVLDLAEERERLAEIARSHRVTHIVVNHVIDRPPDVFAWIAALCAELGCGYDVVLHDYVALCPRVDLVTGTMTFCDAAPPETCARCVRRYGSEVERVIPGDWRRRSLMFLDGARRIVAPSEDLALRMRRHVPAKRITVWHPEDDGSLPMEVVPVLQAGEPMRIATLGALNVSKGARVLRGLAEHVAAAGAPLSFSVLGPAVDGRALRRAGVHVIGRYRSDALDGLIAEAAPHLVLLPAIWPETWSFVLTAALRHRLPVAVFDIGAPAERLRRLGRGHILPLALASDPRALMAALLGIRQSWLAPA